MSAASDVAVLVPAGARGGATRAGTRAAERPLVRWASFSALALYGTVRWGTLISPAPTGRLMGLFAVAIALAGAGVAFAHRSRPLVLLAAALAILASFAFAGVPVPWVTHFRIAVTASGIGQGLSDLPRVLLPYLGINQWILTVMLLGAAVLLLDAALIVGLAGRRMSDGRRVAAVIPLIALAIVPSTLIHPTLPYLQGLILFLLVAAFMWGERLAHGDALAATILALLAGAIGMVLAPALSASKPWLNYQALANNLAAHPESFDWSQRYGPLRWPQTGKAVFEVQAPRPDYWKTENLDVFNERGWGEQSVEQEGARYGVAVADIRRWSQTLHVTLRAIKTDQVIAAGTADVPTHVSGAVGGLSDGTWVDPSGLGPGDSYDVTTYDPRPSAAQLEAAGTGYVSGLLPGYLTVDVPVDPTRSAGGVAITGNGATAGVQHATAFTRTSVILPPFGSLMANSYSPSTTPPSFALDHSPYARAYALARRLASGVATPYAFVMSVKRYLDSGAYSYDQNPPRSRFPLETFLFKDKRGYCQQFAGAMALLLRFGGVPARVATGFTPGTYDNASHSWVVSDTDAHAWVEAWFPGYGWVRFDPTPAAAPALGGHVALPQVKGAKKTTSNKPASHGLSGGGSVSSSVVHHKGGGFPAFAVIALVILAAMLALALRAMVRLSEPSGEELLAELEQAFARSGRRMPPGTTLARVEQRLQASPEAEAYVRTLRLTRFAGQSQLPSRKQRRALRDQLRVGLGPLGRLRVLWALPPRFRLRLPVWRGRWRGIHST